MDNWLLPFKADFARPKVGYDSKAVVFILTPPGDHLAHTIQISCYDGDSPVDVTAYTAAGHFKRRDGNVVLVEDTVSVSANIVTLVLPQECYAYPGAMHGIVRLTDAQTGGKVTILDMWFIVPESVDGGTVDPGEVIPSIDDLLAQIEAMEEATAAAEAAAAAVPDMIAPTFSTSEAYASGDYVYYDGDLYRFTTAHAAGAWTGTDAVEVQLSPEVADLKSAVEAITVVAYGKNRFDYQGDLTLGYYLNSSGELVESASWGISDYCYVAGFENVVCWSNNSGNLVTMWYACAYNENKEFISSLGGASSFSLPEGCAYIRFCSTSMANSEYTAQLMLESGTTKTTYETFSKTVKIVTDKTLTLTDYAADAKVTGDAIAGIQTTISGMNDSLADLPVIADKFNDSETVLPLAEYDDGYINDSGNVVTSGAGQYKYTSVTITEAYVGKTLSIDGSAWYAIKPYVFVGVTSISVPSVENPGATVTQYEGLTFTPMETGTLYINRYGTQKGAVALLGIGTLKKTELPSDILDGINYFPEFSPQTLTMTSNKLLNASTGEITSANNENWRVSDYVDIEGAQSIKITTEMFYGYALYVFYDSNKEYISGRASASGGTVTSVYLEEAEVPVNAKYIVVGYLYQASMPNPYLFANKTAKNISPAKRWAGRKWVCVGDSLTANNDRASYHYFDYVSEATGISVVNMGMSGTGYANGQGNNNAFYQRIASIPSDADVVTIFGSFNDLATSLQLGEYTDSGTTTIAGCVNATLDALYDVIPLARVALVSPTPWNSIHPGDEGSQKNYVELLAKIAEYRSVPFLDLWRESGLRPWDSDFKELAYSNDEGNGVHPDAIGHGIFAPRFRSLLEKMLM